MSDAGTIDSEIKARFLEEWLADSTSSSVTVVWQAVRSEVPDSPDTDGNAAPWARCVVLHADGEDAAIGGTFNESSGLVVVSIFTPAGYGVTAGLDLATIAKRAFQGKETDGGAWFTNVAIKTVGESGNWFQHNVTATFRYWSN